MNIIISKTNIELLNNLYIENRGYEYGGVLLGKKQNGNYIITDIIYNNNIILSRSRFIRNIVDVKDIMRKCIIKSNYEVDYIGEWHTHPGSSSLYSNIDKRAMIELNKDFSELILLIKGENKISAYMFTVNHIEELKINIKEDF